MASRKPRGSRKRARGFVDILNGVLSLFVIGVLVAAGIVLWGVNEFYTDGPVTEDASFIVERGDSLSSVATRLENVGLVRNRWIFQLGGQALRKQADLRAGEFLIAADSSMADILHELTEGRAIQHRVIIPEGFTAWQVVDRINSEANLTGEIGALPPEGSLLPGSYDFQRGENRQAVLERMGAAQAALIAEIWENRAPDLPLESPEELVILASIVEKETGVAEERGRVASVFVNRLRRGMRLQSDPTIIYGITRGQGALGRGLLRSEIEQRTDYNTYQIDGLPPTPIASPGREALQATANPEDTPYLYFVADGTGGHAFAETYAEHRANVARWREIERQRAVQAEADAEDAREALEAEEAEEAGDPTAVDD